MITEDNIVIDGGFDIDTLGEGYLILIGKDLKNKKGFEDGNIIKQQILEGQKAMEKIDKIIKLVTRKYNEDVNRLCKIKEWNLLKEISQILQGSKNEHN